MKEKALQRSEEDEIRELKNLIITKLSEASVKGFETRSQLLERIMSENITNQEERMDEEAIVYELDERTYLGYKKNQFDLLEKLLTSSYFLQNQNNRTDDKEEEEKALYLTEVINKPGGAHFMRREKKVMTIKLSRYIRNDLVNMHNEHIDVKKFVGSLDEKDYHKIGVNELEKFIKVHSDKSYYNPKIIEENYEKVKDYLLDLKRKGRLSAKDLTDKEIDQLIEACSFSLNGVHYLQKFKKTKNMIHPIDLLFILSKIK